MNIKEIFTIILLLEYKILNKTFEENILDQAKDSYLEYNYLTRENFKKIQFWFETDNNFTSSKFIFLIFQVWKMNHISKH